MTKTYQLEKVVCNFCGSADSKPFIPRLRVVRCKGCGLVHTNERLPLEALREIYSKDYFTSAVSKDLGYDDYEANRVEIKRTFIKRLQMLERIRNGVKGNTIDVGCAMGFFVDTAQQSGWQAEGIDISGYCVNYGKSQGLKLSESTVQELNGLPESYDLITMWDYIEHSPTPKEDLKKAFQLLKKNGVLALATPDIASLPAKIFKENWMGFKEHEHLFYFSGKVLKKALKEIGFEIVREQYVGKYVSLEFFARRIGLYFPVISKWLRFLIKKNWISNFQFYCNPWDITLIVARKK